MVTWGKIVSWFIVTFILSVAVSCLLGFVFMTHAKTWWYGDGYYTENQTYVYNEETAQTAVSIPVQSGSFYITKNTINPDIVTISAPANTTFKIDVNGDIQEYTTKSNENNVYTAPLTKGEVKIITETETLVLNGVIKL